MQLKAVLLIYNKEEGTVKLMKGRVECTDLKGIAKKNDKKSELLKPKKKASFLGEYLVFSCIFCKESFSPTKLILQNESVVSA